MRAAIYVRVSSEEQAQHGYSLDAQRHACRIRAQQLGATTMVEFADEGVPGTILERPGLTKLRQAVMRRDVDVVVIYDPDRFARSLAHQLLVTDEIERAKIRLDFVNFEWQNTPEGKLFYAMRGAFSEYEREKIRLRTSTGRIQKARQGKLPMAVKPYGYRYDALHSQLVVDAFESAVVQRIFTELVEEGWGLNRIAKQLTREGIPTQKGASAWHRQVVRQIARNPVYTGIFYANRFNTAGMRTNRYRSLEERVHATLRPENEWIPIAVPPIVSPALWQQAQAVMEQRAFQWREQKKDHRYLLSGLVHCCVCERTMTGYRKRQWGRVKTGYTCRKNTAGPSEANLWGDHAIDAPILEAIVWDRVMNWLNRPEQLVRVATDSSAVACRVQEDRLGDALLDRVIKGQENLLNLLESGIPDPDGVIRRLQKLQEQEQKLRKQLEHQTDSLSSSQWGAEEARHWLQSARDNLPLQTRYLVVHALIQEIWVSADTIIIRGKNFN